MMKKRQLNGLLFVLIVIFVTGCNNNFNGTHTVEEPAIVPSRYVAGENVKQVQRVEPEPKIEIGLEGGTWYGELDWSRFETSPSYRETYTEPTLEVREETTVEVPVFSEIVQEETTEEPESEEAEEITEVECEYVRDGCDCVEGIGVLCG